jgi:hypothetical protein
MNSCKLTIEAIGKKSFCNYLSRNVTYMLITTSERFRERMVDVGPNSIINFLLRGLFIPLANWKVKK